MEIYTTPNNPMRNGYGYMFSQLKSSPPQMEDNTTSDCMGKLGYAFVPVQTFNDIYSPGEGLMAGTIFPELNKPFGVYGAEV